MLFNSLELKLFWREKKFFRVSFFVLSSYLSILLAKHLQIVKI